MLKKYFFITFLIPFTLLAQTDPYQMFENLDKSDMETSILFNHGISFSDIANEERTHFDTNGFFQAYNELGAADELGRFKKFKILKDAQLKSYFNNVIPIGLIFTEFDIIKNEALENGDVLISGNQLIKAGNAEVSIFEMKQRLITAPFRLKSKALSVDFSISEEFFINTTSKNISSISIDFGDGTGYRSVSVGNTIPIQYTSSGVKEMKITVVLDSQESFTTYSNITVGNQVSNNRDTEGSVIPFISGITPDLSAYGEPTNYPGEGEYQIFLDTDDNTLDKPIFIVDGFDPGDGRDIAGLYSALDFASSMGPQNLADDLRTQGFDIVILNFPVYTRAADMQLVDGGADFIERNAMLLVELIDIINTAKTGAEQNVIIGPSMGGLIARYALNYMENQTLTHDTRLFLSFDSPHRGANVPIGVQHQLNYLAYGLGAFNLVELQPVVDGMLKSPAARQMLVDHMESHLMGGSDVEFDPALVLPVQNPWKTIFDSSINSLTVNGFPQTVRNVSLINGSGIGNPFQDKIGGDILPGFTFLNDTFVIDAPTFTNATLIMNFTPATVDGSQLVSSVAITVFGLPFSSSMANSQAFSYSDGVDAASGGLFNMSALGGTNPPPGLVADFFNALQADYFNFIPSISGMALDITANGEIDWFHDIQIGAGNPPSAPPQQRDVLDSTPFINWYMPDDNEEHITLTEPNVVFALTEILSGTLSVGSEQLGTIRLEKNPIQNELTLLTSIPLQKANLVLFDISGRVVHNVNLGNTTERISVPIYLSSGLYIVKLTSDSGSFTTKLVVE